MRHQNMKKFSRSKMALIAGSFVLMNFAYISSASAHCDGMDGPVIMTAKSALQNGDVTPLLKWIPKNSEQTIKSAFEKTLAERKAGKETTDIVDERFFSTLVKVHRESEGASFTGIKPAGQIEPIVIKADTALKNKNINHLAETIAKKVELEIRKKFEKVILSEKESDKSVELGRKYVSNYIQYVHFVEEIHNAVSKTDVHGESHKKPEHKH
jgi:hypothetical protein